MATIDLGEAKTLAQKFGSKARDEALKLGTKAWEKAPGTFAKLMEEPRSFIDSFRPPPPQPSKTHWAYVAGVAALGFVAGAAAIGAGKSMVGVLPAQANWVEAMKADREKIEALFDALIETTDKQVARRKLLVARLRRLIGRNAIAEENILSPMLREAGRSAEAKELSGLLFDIRGELHSLSESAFGDFGFTGKIEALRILVEAHLRRQEEVYPDFQSGLSDQENLKLARAIAREGMRLS